MGKMKDVLIEIEELTEQNDDLIARNTELHKTVYDLKELLEMERDDLKVAYNRMEYLSEENARLSEVARKEMMSANQMRRVIYNALQRIDGELTVAFHEIDECVVRDH